MQKSKVMDELKYKALIQESEALTTGFKSGIRTLCTSFYSKEILVKDVYQLSLRSHESISDESLVERVLSALRERVELDSDAFDVIVKVLYATTALDYLAKRLENRLATLRKEQETQRMQQEIEARVLNRDALVMPASRPNILHMADMTRKLSMGPETEPANIHGSARSIQAHLGGEASSLGAGTLAGGPTPTKPGPGNHQQSPVYSMYQPPIEKTHTHKRDDSRGRLAIGMNKPQFPGMELMMGDEGMREWRESRGRERECVSLPVGGDIVGTQDFSQKQEPTPPSHQTARGHDPNATPTITRSRCSDVTRPQPDMLGQKSESTTGTVKQESGAVLETRTERVVRSSSVYYVPSGHAHAHSVSSKDDFQTPPSSPRLEDTESEEEAPRSLGRVCVECTEMKEKIDYLETKLETLQLVSTNQIWSLKSELNQADTDNYEKKLMLNQQHQQALASEERHRKQDALINQLGEQVRTLQQRLQSRSKTSAQESKLEKVQRDEENFKKKQLKLEKEEANRLKMMYMQDNAKLREHNLELKDEVLRLYSELKRVNSMQCEEFLDDQVDTSPSSGSVGGASHFTYDHTHQQEVAASYSTQQPAPGRTPNHTHQTGSHNQQEGVYAPASHAPPGPAPGHTREEARYGTAPDIPPHGHAHQTAAHLQGTQAGHTYPAPLNHNIPTHPSQQAPPTSYIPQAPPTGYYPPQAPPTNHAPPKHPHPAVAPSISADDSDPSPRQHPPTKSNSSS